MARIRAEQAGTDPHSAVAARDILVGMMLEHPDDAEPTVLLQHFRFVPGHVLPLDYSLAPLLGETPRSVKRFVNLYQLLRIVQRSAPSGPAEQPPIEQLTAFVLALGNGLPEIGPRLMDQLRSADQGQTLQTVLLGLADAASNERKRLDSWLAARPDWQQIPESLRTTRDRRVDRFLFRLGRS